MTRMRETGVHPPELIQYVEVSERAVRREKKKVQRLRAPILREEAEAYDKAVTDRLIREAAERIHGPGPTDLRAVRVINLTDSE